jgi:hypothetical protein
MVVVLLTVIVLAGFVTTQLSMQSSRSQLAAFTASEMAQDATDQAIGLLRYATTGTNQWVTQPGQITLYEPGNTNEVLSIALHSGLAASVTNGVNANAASIQNSTEGSISYDIANSMPLQWIYVRQNGERSTSSGYITNNPVVGRYAFWVDDESSKININTAWTRSAANTNIASHASKIPLQGAFTNLTDAQLSQVTGYRANRFFSSQLDILKSFGTNAPLLADDIRRAKFWTTHVNSSPSSELTYFGEPKIVLTTIASRAGGRPYINTNTTPAPNPSTKTIDLIVSYLERVDWPMAPGESFQKKYYGGEANKARLRQIAQNIFEYVRAKESPDLMVKPWRGHVIPDTVAHAGPSRRFRMVEVGFWRNSNDPTKGRAYCVLHLPRNAGISMLEINNNDIKWDWAPITETINGFQGGLGNFTLAAGEYKVLSLPMGTNIKYPYPSDGHCLMRFYWTENGIRGPNDYYPSSAAISARRIENTLNIPITTSAPLSGDDPTIPQSTASIQTISVDDPFLGGSPDDWKLTPGINNFTKVSDRSAMREISGIGKEPANPSLGQDLDKDGKITDDGIYLPPPAGTAGNKSGRVESLAELGYIHSGMQAPGMPSVPFRTLRMQPQNKQAGYAPDALPDWAILDLFALPVDTTGTNALLNRPNARGGLVSLNSTIQPFTNITRSQSLQALVKDLPSLSQSEQLETATNLMKKLPANNSLVAGKIYGSTNIFRFPGEIAEIKGVSDAGEASEQNFRQLIDLVTTSGNVFSVYAIGQSIVQSPNGKIVTRGEYRQVSLVERSAQASGVKFRVLFNKALGY